MPSLLVKVLLLLKFALTVSALLPWERDNSTGYGTLTTRSLYNGSVLRVGMNNPPLNLFDYRLNTDLTDFLDSIQAAGLANDSSSSPPKVVIFHSEVPDFFMWWYDVNYFLSDRSPFPPNTTDTLFTNSKIVVQLLRELPTIFIAEVDGRASGTGDEFLLQCDMSFVGPNAILSNPEAALGGMAVDGGAEYLVRALGIQRASEYLLGVIPVQGAEAAQLGWVNRAFDTTDALKSYVDGLARRIAYIDAGPLNITKTAIRAWGPSQKQTSANFASLQRVVPSETATFEKEIALAGNFTTVTAWTLEMFRSLKALEELHRTN